MKVYIAGKITGDPDYVRKFAQAEKILTDLGYTVLNPTWYPDGLTKKDYIRLSLACIDASDLVLFLSDYRDSGGALIEKSYCSYVGVVSFDFDDYLSATHSAEIASWSHNLILDDLVPNPDRG